MGGDFESDNYEFGREKKNLLKLLQSYRYIYTEVPYIILYLRGDDNKERVYHFLYLEVVKDRTI